MKLIRKFFLDSKSDNNLFKSDLVTLLRTPASSTTYVSFGGPSLSTSNSEANEGKTGLKLSAKEIAKAAKPFCKLENKLVGVAKDLKGSFLMEQEMGFEKYNEFDLLGLWV